MFPNGGPQPEPIGPIAARYGLGIDPSTIPCFVLNMASGSGRAAAYT